MDKFLNTMPWLTVPGTPRYFSDVFDREVTNADVYQLILKGKLKLSVDLTDTGGGVSGNIGKTVTVPEGEHFYSQLSKSLGRNDDVTNLVQVLKKKSINHFGISHSDGLEIGTPFNEFWCYSVDQFFSQEPEVWRLEFLSYVFLN